MHPISNERIIRPVYSNKVRLKESTINRKHMHISDKIIVSIAVTVLYAMLFLN